MGLGRLKDKVAIVTGAGRGCGRGIALAFADEGARVIVASRTASTVEEVVGEIKAAGGSALGVACDIGNRDDVLNTVSKAVAQFGTVDILVNNAQGFGTEAAPAGAPRITPLEDYDEDEWDYMYLTGVKGTLWAMKAAFPHLRKRGGKIINFGSAGGQLGTKFVAGYNAAKEAVRALSRTAAQEWGQHGITVNVINPMIKTDAMTDWYAARPDQQAADIAKLPMGRVGEIKDVAGVAIFLASGESDFVTGMTFMVDGGFVMFA